RGAELDEARVLAHPGDQDAGEVDVGLGAAREPDGVAQLHARREAHLALDPDIASHGDEATLTVGYRMDGDRVSGCHGHCGYHAADELVRADRDDHARPPT